MSILILEAEINILNQEVEQIAKEINLHDRKVRELRRNKQNKEADKEVKEVVNKLIEIAQTRERIIRKQNDIIQELKIQLVRY